MRLLAPVWKETQRCGIWTDYNKVASNLQQELPGLQKVAAE
jgi:hypothetical protein